MYELYAARAKLGATKPAIKPTEAKCLVLIALCEVLVPFGAILTCLSEVLTAHGELMLSFGCWFASPAARWTGAHGFPTRRTTWPTH